MIQAESQFISNPTSKRLLEDMLPKIFHGLNERGECILSVGMMSSIQIKIQKSSHVWHAWNDCFRCRQCDQLEAVCRQRGAAGCVGSSCAGAYQRARLYACAQEIHSFLFVNLISIFQIGSLFHFVFLIICSCFAPTSHPAPRTPHHAPRTPQCL